MTFKVELIILIEKIGYLLLLGYLLYLALRGKNIKNRTLFGGIGFCLISNIANFLVFSWFTFILWKSNNISRYLLPPYQPYYFYKYAFFHFGFSFVLALLFASFLLFPLFFLFYKLSFSTKQEITLAFLGGIISGWPNIILYLALTFVLALILSAINRKNKVSISIPLILSVIIILILGAYLDKLIGLNVLIV